MKNHTDDQLMKLISQGHEKAFAELFARYGGIFLGYAMSILKDQTHAEDISQETWIKIVRLAPSYQPNGHFVAWVYTMIRNQAFNLLKSKGFSAKEDFDDLREEEIPVSSVGSFESELIEQQDLQQMKTAFYELPETQRQCLSLWLNEELSYEEIATQLNISLAAVKTHLFRAKETLKQNLKGGR